MSEEERVGFYARVSKLCTASAVYCCILEHEQAPQLFHGKPDVHCTRTWLVIEQSVLNYQNNPGVFPRGNPDGYKKRALGKAQQAKYQELHELLREYVDAHAPCYVVLQSGEDRQKNLVFRSGLWERLPVAQAIEMALAYIPEPTEKKQREQRPASVKACVGGDEIEVFAPKRLRKCLTQQWPKHAVKGKCIFKITLSDYPGTTLEGISKRIKKWEECIKEGKEIHIVNMK